MSAHVRLLLQDKEIHEMTLTEVLLLVAVIELGLILVLMVARRVP